MSVCLKLSDRMRGREFLVSIQLDPPSTANIYDFKMTVERLLGAGANIFDINSSRRVSHDSIQLASEFSRVGIDVIPHVTLRGGSLPDITNQIFAAYVWSGVRSFIIIAGDPHDQEKAIFHSPGVYQTRTHEALKVFDNCLRKSGLTPDVEFAAAVNQNEPDIGLERSSVCQKELAGADFFMSQPVFDLDQALKLRDFSSCVSAPVMTGIWPMVSKKTARKIMDNKIVGVKLPEPFFAEMIETRDCDVVGWGIRQARDLIHSIKENRFFGGVYIVAPFKDPLTIKSLVREFSQP